jgi:hypothetical protein
MRWESWNRFVSAIRRVASVVSPLVAAYKGWHAAWVEKPAAKVPGVLNAPEPLRKSRLVFQGFEVAFGERVAVGSVRSVERTGDTKIGQQKRGRFGLHWPAPIGVQRELHAGTPYPRRGADTGGQTGRRRQ